MFNREISLQENMISAEEVMKTKKLQLIDAIMSNETEEASKIKSEGQL